MSKLYYLQAYKPLERGAEGDEQSDFAWPSIEREELIERAAEMLASEVDEDVSWHGASITIFASVNGGLVIYHCYNTRKALIDSYTMNETGDLGTLPEEIGTRVKQLRDATEAKKWAEVAKREKERETDKEKRRESTRKRELAQLARLKTKYRDVTILPG